MSRIGKAPIPVPSGVDVTVADGRVTVKGPKGSLDRVIPGTITIRQEGDELLVERPDDERQSRAMHGLVRSLVNNMVVGVTDDLTARFSAVDLAKLGAIILGGTGGGGRPDMAQAGGPTGTAANDAVGAIEKNLAG